MTNALDLLPFQVLNLPTTSFARVATVLVLLVGCNTDEMAPDAATTRAVVSATLASLVDSARGGPVLVRPLVAADLAFFDEVEPYDPTMEPYFFEALPTAARDLFERGRLAQGTEVTLSSLTGSGFQLLARDDDSVWSDSIGTVRSRLRSTWGAQATVVAFAPLAVSASGNEALLYSLHDALLPMGRSTAYTYLHRTAAGWSVVRRLTDYVE